MSSKPKNVTKTYCFCDKTLFSNSVVFFFPMPLPMVLLQESAERDKCNKMQTEAVKTKPGV